MVQEVKAKLVEGEVHNFTYCIDLNLPALFVGISDDGFRERQAYLGKMLSKIADILPQYFYYASRIVRHKTSVSSRHELDFDHNIARIYLNSDQQLSKDSIEAGLNRAISHLDLVWGKVNERLGVEPQLLNVTVKLEQ
jgi:hypothetical protein